MASIGSASLLIVEDDRLILDDLRETFSTYPDLLSNDFCHIKFEVDTASNYEEAVEKLQAAARGDDPFDALLLDLGLPRLPTAQVANNPQVGLDLLKALNERSCRSVVVASAHGDKPWVLIELVRTALVYDFVSKPWDANNVEISTAVVNAVRNVRRIQWLELARKRAERWLVAQSLETLAGRFGEVLSSGFGEIHDETIRLAETCDDEDHTEICGRLTGFVNRVMQSMAEQCRMLSTPALSGDVEFGECDLTAILSESVSQHRSGIECHRLSIKLPSEPCLVTSIEDEVRVVVDELVFGAIEASPETMPIAVELTRSEERQTVELHVSDSGVPVDTELCRRFDNGHVLGNEDGRVYGLSLAQRLARNLAGRISIDQQPDADGNRITFSLPVAPHDTSPARRIGSAQSPAPAATS